MRRHTWTRLWVSILVVGMVGPAWADDSGRKIVHLELKGTLAEAPQSNPFGLSTDSLSTKELLERFKKVRGDDEVAALFITLDSPSLGLAQVQDIRTAIEQVKAADKEVYVHLDSCMSTLHYWLVSAATKIAVVPTGDLWVTGFYGEQLFLKDALNNIKVNAEVVHIGDYKSAGEIFARNEPSPEAAEMTNWLFDDLYQQMLEQIAASRSMSPDELKTVVDNGPYSAETALKAGLIDQVAYRKEFVDEIKRRHGDLPFDKEYGEKDLDLDLSGNPFTALSEMFSKMMQGAQSSKGAAVALVYVEGVIHLGEGENSLFGSAQHGASGSLRKALYEAAYDDDVKAVVLRVESPGGSAVASEIIWNATQEIVRQGKPLVVSMGNVAGSGGYYVSCGADMIFAEPGTLTGSIGVVGMKLVTREMWEWLGVHWHPIQRGANAGLMSSSAPFTEEGLAKIRGWMEEVYDVFKSRVQAGRGDRLTKPLESIAGGRVFTGRQAVDVGLVDKLGGLQDALRYAALEAGLGDDFSVRIMPKPKSLIDLILEELGMEARLATRPAALAPSVHQVLPLLEALEPLRGAALRRALQAVELLQREQVSVLMPAEIVIH